MFINNFDPVAFEFLSFEIRWYSLAYILGILAGWTISKKYLIRDTNLFKSFDDYITYLIVAIILGGRLGYVLIYNFEYYINNFLDIFKIWQGGMSFHGALLGIVLITIWFAKKEKLNSFQLLDIIAVVAPIGIFFGRIANYINSELYGIVTNVPWAVKFLKVDNFYRHPSQIYEALLEGLVLFILMLFIYFRKNYKTGMCSYTFLIFYGIFRIFSEIFREPDTQIGYLFGLFSMGTLLSIFMASMGLFLYFYFQRYEKKT